MPKKLTRINKLLINKLIALLICLCVGGFQLTLSAEPLVLTDDERAWLKANPTIIYGSDSFYEPVEFVKDSQHTGMSADYVKLIEEKLGVKFTYKLTKNWNETYALLLDGRIDFVPTLKPTPEREKVLEFTEPYLNLRGVLITSKASTDSNLDLENMAGKKIAVVQNYFWEGLLKNDHPNIETVSVPDLASGLQETALGTVDAFLASFATASSYIQQKQITNLHVAGQAPYVIDYSASTRNDKPELTALLNKALTAISPEEHQTIRDRWIKLSYEEPVLSQRSLWGLLGLLTLTAITTLGAMFWSQSLRKQVKQKTKELWNTNQSLELKVYERTQDLRRANERLRGARDLLQDSNEKLEDEANRDALTGIANRRRLDEYLEEAVNEAASNSTPLTIMLADIDYFKQFNDHYGHLIGDDCLREVAQCLRRYCSRDGELVARYGGEEFCLTFKGMTAIAAREHANLVLTKIRELQIENIDSPDKPYITLSIGVTTLNANKHVDSAKNLLEQADKALYQAKQNGRGIAVSYNDIS